MIGCFRLMKILFHQKKKFDFFHVAVGFMFLRGDGNHALLNDDIAILGGLAGNDDGVSLLGAVIERKTLDALDLAFVAESLAVLRLDRRIESVAGNGGHHDYRNGISVKLEKRNDTLEKFIGPDSVGANDAAVERVGREMGVGNDDFVTMAHFSERFEKIW